MNSLPHFEISSNRDSRPEILAKETSANQMDYSVLENDVEIAAHLVSRELVHCHTIPGYISVDGRYLFQGIPKFCKALDPDYRPDPGSRMERIWQECRELFQRLEKEWESLSENPPTDNQ